MPETSTRVAIVKTTEIDDDTVVRSKMFELLNQLKESIVVPENAHIIIKVNLCLLLDWETGATIDPRLVKYLAEWLQNQFRVKEIIVVESDATALSADRAYYGLGWDHILEDVPNLRYLNLTKDEHVKVNIEGLYFKELEMSKTYMEADYIVSFAKLKTHSMQLISGIMKNQFGTLPEKLKVVYHPHLEKVICDLVRVRPPDLCLVDGLIAHEGPGPVSGTPRVMGLIISGTDALATDQVCARIMGINPSKVPHLKLAAKNHLGSTNYTITGCCVEEVAEDFEVIPTWRQAWGFVKQRLSHE